MRAQEPHEYESTYQLKALRCTHFSEIFRRVLDSVIATHSHLDLNKSNIFAATVDWSPSCVSVEHRGVAVENCYDVSDRHTRHIWCKKKKQSWAGVGVHIQEGSQAKVCSSRQINGKSDCNDFEFVIGGRRLRRLAALVIVCFSSHYMYLDILFWNSNIAIAVCGQWTRGEMRMFDDAISPINGVCCVSVCVGQMKWAARIKLVLT